MNANRIAIVAVLLSAPLPSYAVTKFVSVIDSGKALSAPLITAEDHSGTKKTVPINETSEPVQIGGAIFKGMPKSQYQVSLNFKCINKPSLALEDSGVAALTQDYAIAVQVVLDGQIINEFNACEQADDTMWVNSPQILTSTSQFIDVNSTSMTGWIKSGKHSFEVNAKYVWSGSIEVTNQLIEVTWSTKFNDVGLIVEPIKIKSAISD